MSAITRHGPAIGKGTSSETTRRGSLRLLAVDHAGTIHTGTPGTPGPTRPVRRRPS